MNPTNVILVTERQEYFESLGWDKFEDKFQALAKIDEHEEIMVDTETTGLGSFIKEKVNAYQIGIPGAQFVFDAQTIPLSDEHVVKTLNGKIFYGHNLAFDMPYFYQAKILPYKIVDTIISESLFMQGLLYHPSRDKSLDATLYRHCGITLDKSLQKTIHLGLDSVEDIMYAGQDVRDIFSLAEAQRGTAARRRLERRVEFENLFLFSLAYMEYSGVYVDKEMLNTWIRYWEAEEVFAERKLKEDYADINWASPQQVGEILRGYGIEHVNDDTGNLMTGDDVLNRYDLPIVKDIQAFREAAKIVSTYGRKWYSYIQSDGRIHTKYKQIVDTGRTSCGETDRRRMDPWDLNYVCEKPFPNMQNLPKPKKGAKISMRDCFIAGPHNILVGADFSGQESIILADQSEDPNMLALFGTDGADPHSYVVRIAYPELAHLTDEEIKAQHPDERDACKTAAFAIAFGGNGKTIAENLNCSRELGDHIYDSYMAAFPKLKDFFRECLEFAVSHRYMPTDWIFEGKRFFDRAAEFQEWYNKKDYWRRYYKEKEEDTNWYKDQAQLMDWYRVMKSSLRKESVNTRIQGTAAVMSKLALIYFFDWILKNKLFGKVLICIFVHDEIVVECHKRSAEKVAKALQECMERAGRDCLKNLTIKAEAKIMERWTK